MKNLIYLLVLFLLPVEQADVQNFEGVITYKRETREGVVLFEKYFMKGEKLRIEGQYITRAREKKDYTILFLFDEYIDTQFTYNSSTDEFDLKKLKPSSMISIDEVDEKNAEVLKHDCDVFLLAYEPVDIFEFTSQTKQKVWLSNQFKFELPKEWNNSPYMLTHFDGRIILKMVEYGENNYTEGYYYERTAIDIDEKILPDSLFKIKK